MRQDGIKRVCLIVCLVVIWGCHCALSGGPPSSKHCRLGGSLLAWQNLMGCAAKRRPRLSLRGGVILEPWETEDTTWPADEGAKFDVPGDVLRDWDKAKEDEFAKMCERELEDYWEEQRKQREIDVANGDIGCDYVADDEWCIRCMDGNIYKFKYEPQPFSISGPNTQSRRLPRPVDKINPDAIPKIVKDLDRRDAERRRLGREIEKKLEQETALAESLSWYNGSKRFEFENGKILWWRSPNSSSCFAVNETEDSVDEDEEDISTFDAVPDVLDPSDLPQVDNNTWPFRLQGQAVPKNIVPDFSRYFNASTPLCTNSSEQSPFGFCWDDYGEELRSCVWRGKVHLVRELLALGADPNYRTVYAGWRPLHFAAWNDRAIIALDLIEAGAEKDAQNDHGQTALHLAATRASTTCIPALLDAGCNPNIRHVEGRLPLEVAHMRMLSGEYPGSLRAKEAVLQLAAVTEDIEAKQGALEDAEDKWVPMEGFAS